MMQISLLQVTKNVILKKKNLLQMNNEIHQILTLICQQTFRKRHTFQKV